MHQDPLVLDPTARRRAEEEKVLHMADGPVLVDSVHFCLGAPLARAEGATALAGLFDRFPALRLAVPPADLEPVASILGNGHAALPVRLYPE